MKSPSASLSRQLLSFGTSAFLLIICGSCLSSPYYQGRKPFSLQLIQQYNLSSDEITQLQLYVSDTIVLRRELSSAEKSITPGHGLRMEKGKAIDELVIAAGTPCVILALVDSYTFSVSFEKEHFLLFSQRAFFISSKRDGAPDCYSLIDDRLFRDAEARRREVEVRGSFGNYLVMYGGKEYYTPIMLEDNRWQKAILLVDEASLLRVKKTSRKLPGVQLK